MRTDYSRPIGSRIEGYVYCMACSTLNVAHLAADLSMSMDGGGETTRALSQILDTAYNLEFNERTSTSAVRLFVERIKQAFQVRVVT